MHRKSKQRAPKSLPIIVGMWGRAQTWREDGFTLLVTLWPTQREWEFQSGTRITTQCLSGQEALIDRPFPLPMSKWLWSYYRKLEAEAAHSQSSPVNASLWTPDFTHFHFPALVPSQSLPLIFLRWWSGSLLRRDPQIKRYVIPNTYI